MLVLPRSTLIVVMMMLYMTRVILESVDPSITFIPFQFDAKFLPAKNVKHTFFPAIAQDSNSKHKFFSPVHDLEFHIYHVELQTLKIHKK